MDFRACDRHKDTIFATKAPIFKACRHRLLVASCATALAHAVGRLRHSFSVGAQSKAGRLVSVILGFFGKLCVQVTSWQVEDIVMSSDKIG